MKDTMQELVKRNQISTENNEVNKEQDQRSNFCSSQQADQMREPLNSVNHKQPTPEDAFVGISMSHSTSESVNNALVVLGKERQPRTCGSKPQSSQVVGQRSSLKKTSTSGEYKMRGRHSKRFTDDKNKRSRTTFNAAQINALEKIFEGQQYPDQPLREKIAERLEMEEQKVVIWFQNRRAKYKRNNRSDHVNTNSNRTGIDMIGKHSTVGNFKQDSHRGNVNRVSFQQHQFQGASYGYDKIPRMTHGPISSINSTTQPQRPTKDVQRNAYCLDGFTSSPEPVTSSVDVEAVTPSLKKDKPLIQEPPPNQICTNAGCQDEMRQALLQWRTRQNMASQLPNQSPVVDSISSGVMNPVSSNISSVNTCRYGEPQVNGDVHISPSISSSSESEDDNYQMNQENTQYINKTFPTGPPRVTSTNFRGHQNPLYLDIPSVSSGDVSSPAPHSTTSTVSSWPSTSDLSSVDANSPAQANQFESEPLSDITRFNVPTPTGVNWSGTCNGVPRKQSYTQHVINPYVDDLPPVMRHNEISTQRCRRRLKSHRTRHQEKRKYQNNNSSHTIDQYQHYPHNVDDTNIPRQWNYGENIMQRGSFSFDEFAPCHQSQHIRRPQCKYDQSTDHVYNYDRQKYQRHSKRRHYDNNNRLQYSTYSEYSVSQMMGKTTEELRSFRRQNADANLNDFASVGSTPNDSINFQCNGYVPRLETIDQHKSAFPYQTAEWNNPVMEVRVPIQPRRPKPTQPPREKASASTGVVHHYGNVNELLPAVESVSDLSQNLNDDQSATLNHVLESVAEDIFPFSDNFISI